MPQETNGLTELYNIGPTIAKRLEEVVVRSREDLARLGAAEVYRRLVAHSGRKALPVCYYLYSLQGAIDGVPWNDVDDSVKQRLLELAGRARPGRRA